MVQKSDGTSDEKSGDGQRSRDVKLIPVRTVRVDGQAALVEWSDKSGLHRVVIPADDVKDGKAPEDTLEAGVAYGANWESIKLDALNVKALAAALHQEGIWTGPEMLGRMNDVRRLVKAHLKKKTNDNVKIAVRELRNYARTVR